MKQTGPISLLYRENNFTVHGLVRWKINMRSPQNILGCNENYESALDAIYLVNKRLLA